MKAIIENEKYKIYEEYDNDGNKYYLTIPNNNELEYQFFCSLDESIISDDKILKKTNSIYERIIESNKNAIYVHVILENGQLTEAAKDNDTPLYSFLIKRILKTIKDAYQKAIKEKLAGINNNLTFISQNKDDTKFIDWLEINQVLPINRIALNKNYEINPDDTIKISFADNYVDNDITNLTEYEIAKENNSKVKTKKAHKNNHGYGNIILVFTTLIISLLVGITIAYIIIK